MCGTYICYVHVFDLINLYVIKSFVTSLDRFHNPKCFSEYNMFTCITIVTTDTGFRERSIFCLFPRRYIVFLSRSFKTQTAPCKPLYCELIQRRYFSGFSANLTAELTFFNTITRLNRMLI